MTQQDRELAKTTFLDSLNLGKIQRVKLKNDASYRQYERIIQSDGKSLIFMDAPPEKEKIAPFIQVANFLRDNDFSAPEIIVSDVATGFMLLEDFGDDSYSKILNGKSTALSNLSENTLYEKAIDNLINLHKIPTNTTIFNNYDESALIKESNLFIEWYISILNGETISKEIQEEFNLIMKHLLSSIKLFSKVVVLRDYHADNLMWLDDRNHHRKTGLLDFQDAVIGSAAYDLVSLLEDARRDVSPALAEAMITRYLQAFPNYSRKDFNAAYSILGIQRNLKIVGIFTRQASKNKNPFYLSMLPRVWRHINNDLKHPLLLPLKNWLTKIVPTQMKGYKSILDESN